VIGFVVVFLVFRVSRLCRGTPRGADRLLHRPFVRNRPVALALLLEDLAELLVEFGGVFLPDVEVNLLVG